MGGRAPGIAGPGHLLAGPGDALGREGRALRRGAARRWGTPVAGTKGRGRGGSSCRRAAPGVGWGAGGLSCPITATSGLVGSRRVSPSGGTQNLEICGGVFVGTRRSSLGDCPQPSLSPRGAPSPSAPDPGECSVRAPGPRCVRVPGSELVPGRSGCRGCPLCAPRARRALLRPPRLQGGVLLCWQVYLPRSRRRAHL